MSQANPKVDFFFSKAKSWQQEYEQLRAIALDCDLVEELKWGVPCYTYENSNVVLIHGFKEYCALLFMKGALMKDPKSILVQQTENVQSARQIRFTDVKQIEKLKSVIKTYIKDAIAVEQSGAKVEFKKATDFAVAEEFQRQLDQSTHLKEAFEALTPGRQKAYLLHFSSAKQSKTREARVEKAIPKILEGLGIDD
jgi:uncharacterized protein YdeI (YjbR/CyaY-like superfamily)